MRDITYRAKKADNGEWVEGNLVWTKNWKDAPYECFIISHLAYLEYGEFDDLYKVTPETVGQYTGLTDKNRKKIFEGDIVDCWSEGVNAQGTVQQRCDGLWIIYPAWQKHIMWGLCPDEYSHTTVEVIGNIHDNPELLEVK